MPSTYGFSDAIADEAFGRELKESRSGNGWVAAVKPRATRSRAPVRDWLGRTRMVLGEYSPDPRHPILFGDMAELPVGKRGIKRIW